LVPIGTSSFSDFNPRPCLKGATQKGFYTVFDPLVLIAHDVKGEFMVLRSAFERLYKDAGYKITARLGEEGHEGEHAPLMSETSAVNVAAASPSTAPAPSDLPISDANVAAHPAELAPASTQDTPTPAPDVPAPSPAPVPAPPPAASTPPPAPDTAVTANPTSVTVKGGTSAPAA